jgi:hypothetical protein
MSYHRVLHARTHSRALSEPVERAIIPPPPSYEVDMPRPSPRTNRTRAIISCCVSALLCVSQQHQHLRRRDVYTSRPWPGARTRAELSAAAGDSGTLRSGAWITPFPTPRCARRARSEATSLRRTSATGRSSAPGARAPPRATSPRVGSGEAQAQARARPAAPAGGSCVLWQRECGEVLAFRACGSGLAFRA